MTGVVTKEEISDRLNELLKIEIDFSKMTKEDLEALLKVVSEPATLIQLGLRGLRNKATKELLNRPLKEFLDSGFLEELTAKGRGGPLGFGILPAIFGERRKSEKG